MRTPQTNCNTKFFFPVIIIMFLLIKRKKSDKVRPWKIGKLGINKITKDVTSQASQLNFCLSNYHR